VKSTKKKHKEAFSLFSSTKIRERESIEGDMKNKTKKRDK